MDNEEKLNQPVQEQSEEEMYIPAPTYQKPLSKQYEDKAYDINENITVPTPEEISEKILKYDDSITVDDIVREMQSVSEEGYSKTSIVVSLQKIHHFFSMGGNVTPDDFEYLDSASIEFAVVSIIPLDENITSLVLKFQTKNDYFLIQTWEIFKRYQALMVNANQEIAENPDADVSIPRIEYAFAPFEFNGKAVAIFSNPIAGFRTLDDENDENCCLQFLFNNENMDFNLVSIDDEETAELTAEIMRELENPNSMYK